MPLGCGEIIALEWNDVDLAKWQSFACAGQAQSVTLPPQLPPSGYFGLSRKPLLSNSAMRLES